MAELTEAIEAAAHAISVYDWDNGISANGETGKHQRAEATRAITAAAPLIEASVRAKIAEEAAETFDEWRVTGQPAIGYLGYDFTWSPDHNPHLGDPERAARSFVAAIAKEGGWENGPHLSRRTITRTAWEPVEAEHAVEAPESAPGAITAPPDSDPTSESTEALTRHEEET